MADDNFKKQLDDFESRKELPEGPETKELPQYEEPISGALPQAEDEKVAAAAAATGAAEVPPTTDAQEARGVAKTGIWALVAIAAVALGALLYYSARTGLNNDYAPRVAQSSADANDPYFGANGVYFIEGTDEGVDASGIMTGTVSDVPSSLAAGTTAPATSTPQMVVVYLFGYDKAGVPENVDLTSLAKMAVKSGKDVTVKAYTDEHGSVAYNKRLSDRRANAIKDYMVKHGVPASHVKAQGMGPTHAYSGGDMQNRRAEVSLSN